MRNPWQDIEVPSSNYVHPNDRSTWAISELPPQPYLGSFNDAKVMWLLGGFGTGDGMAIDQPSHKDKVLTWTRQNLHSPEPILPNFWLAAGEGVGEFSSTRDVKWWRRATSALHREISTQITPDSAWVTIAKGIFVLEAFPYPAKYRPNKLLPTHDYTRYLLAQWIKTGKPIVIGRAERFWSELEPGLVSAIERGQAIRVKNVQCASLSPGNLVGEAEPFNQIKDLLLKS